jgi:hypothetical protein
VLQNPFVKNWIVLIALHTGLMVGMILDAKKSEVRHALIEATNLIMKGP